MEEAIFDFVDYKRSVSTGEERSSMSARCVFSFFRGSFKQTFSVKLTEKETNLF